MAKRTATRHQMELEFSVKHCSRCNETLPVWNFSPNRARKDGVNTYCKPCTNSYTSARYRADIEKSRARGRERYHRNGDETRRRNREKYAANRESEAKRKARAYKANPDKFLNRNRRWRIVNRERERETNRRYYEANKERVAEWHRIYYESNREAFYVTCQRRRARLRAARSVPFTADELADKWAYWGNRCWVCGGKPTASDHVKPLNKGGAHMLCNLRPICKSCNSRKRDKWPYLLKTGEVSRMSVL